MVKKYKNEKGGREILRTYDVLLKKWDVEIVETDVKIRYGLTHVITAGNPENPPLMLFHGVGDDAAMMWIANAKAWAEKFRIYAVDTMGGPGKSMPNENYGKGFDQCLWIDDILDGLKLEKVSMAGVSNGAFITQLYGSRRPDRTEKLICMAGALRKGDKAPGFFAIMKNMSVFFPEALFPTKNNMARLIDKLCAGSSEKYIKETDLMEHWEALLKYFNKMAMSFHRLMPISEEGVDNLRGKTLFIIGDKDPIAYSPEAVDMIGKSGIDYFILKNAGHTLNYEMSDKINAMVENYILEGVIPL